MTKNKKKDICQKFIYKNISFKKKTEVSVEKYLYIIIIIILLLFI